VKLTEKDGGFVSFLNRLLAEGDRGALAALRRGLGKKPGTSAEMHRYVAPFISEKTSAWRSDCLYICAALYAEWHQGRTTAAVDEPSDLGSSFRRLAIKSDSESLEKRFEALLACHCEELHVHLRHAVSLLRSKDVSLDWGQLLYHITNWNHMRRWVQRQWAQSFWGNVVSVENNEDATTESDS